MRRAASWLSTVEGREFRRIYSIPPAEPASEGVLLPCMGMLVSTAIISARISSTG